MSRKDLIYPIPVRRSGDPMPSLFRLAGADHIEFVVGNAGRAARMLKILEGSTSKMSISPPQTDSYRMFDRISPRYDLLNHLLSFGRDRGWRREVSQIIGESPHRFVLDLACGTCDLILAAFDLNRDIRHGVGIDMAGNMLSVGSRKISARGLHPKIDLVRGDGMRIPLAGETVDFAMIGFGIRNMADPIESLSEIHRVLKAGGRLAVLEFSLPKNGAIRVVYLAYFRYILPFVGGVLSGDRRAYRYMNRTVEAFPYGEAFGRMMERAGFSKVRIVPLTRGVATIYCGEKG